MVNHCFQKLADVLAARGDPTLGRQSEGMQQIAAFIRPPYQSGPVSHLCAFGRQQDIALQKFRHTIKQRNHMRFWLTSYKLRGVPVSIGQISRDPGVRFTPPAWHLSTHKIAPDVDEVRGYLVPDVLLSQLFDTVGWVKSVEVAEPENARRNLTGHRYYTDGLRVVRVLSEELVDVLNIQRLDWELPPEPPLA